MPIFYRADTRTPEEIFKNGFVSRTETWHADSSYRLDIKDINWWKRGIKFSWNQDIISEAESNNIVCMTTCFNSAPIFPVDESKHTYVYAIELPEVEVFDMYNYQLKQAKDIKISSYRDLNSGVYAIGLCGYEAFTPIVKPENIIAAVKCERSSLMPHTAGLQVYSDSINIMFPFDRKFNVGSELFVNEDFKTSNVAKQEEIISNLETMLNTKNHTTSIASAIESAGLPKPKSDSLFLIHLRAKEGFQALKSVGRTIYYAIRNSFSAIYISMFAAKQSMNEKKVIKIHPAVTSGNYGHNEDQHNNILPAQHAFRKKSSTLIKMVTNNKNEEDGTPPAPMKQDTFSTYTPPNAFSL